MVKVKTIGLLYETIADAEKIGLPLDQLDHWREDHELAAIESAIQSAGFSTLRIGSPGDLVKHHTDFKNTVDFIMTLSVGFVSRYRQALGSMACILSGIPCTGPDPYAKIVGQNKHILKSFFNKLGVPTPAWNYVHSSSMINQVYPEFPLIVKPAYEGTSIGISEFSLVNTPAELHRAINFVLDTFKMPVIVEQFIEGCEYKAGYIGNGEDVYKGLLEDVQSDGSSMGNEYMHYKAKQLRKFGKQKRDFMAAEYSEMLRTCDLVYELLGPADYGVFDIRCNKHGEFYIIDYNTDATLHPDKTLAACCRFIDIPYDEMIQTILRSAFKRQGILWI